MIRPGPFRLGEMAILSAVTRVEVVYVNTGNERVLGRYTPSPSVGSCRKRFFECPAEVAGIRKSATPRNLVQGVRCLIEEFARTLHPQSLKVVIRTAVFDVVKVSAQMACGNIHRTCDGFDRWCLTHVFKIPADGILDSLVGNILQGCDRFQRPVSQCHQ